MIFFIWLLTALLDSWMRFVPQKFYYSLLSKIRVCGREIKITENLNEELFKCQLCVENVKTFSFIPVCIVRCMWDIINFGWVRDRVTRLSDFVTRFFINSLRFREKTRLIWSLWWETNLLPHLSGFRNWNNHNYKCLLLLLKQNDVAFSYYCLLCSRLNHRSWVLPIFILCLENVIL